VSNDRRVDVAAIEQRVRVGRAASNMAKYGLAPPEIIRHARPGAVFVVKDEAIAFPQERVPDASRTEHETRRVIVCNDLALCRATAPNTLLVVPCTASQGEVSDWHLAIPSDEPAFTAAKVVALTQLVQPILKSDLIRFVGVLTAGTFVRLQARVAQNLGLLSGSSEAVDAAVQALDASRLAAGKEGQG
jgi:hypothetical protein